MFSNVFKLVIYLICCPAILLAQDDAEKILQEIDVAQREPVLATFKTTRLINFHTIETVGKRTLDFRISHRFGTVNTGLENLWGIDGGASIRLGLEYSYDGRLMVGFGRSSYQKMLDGFLKYRLVRQEEGGGAPISVTLFSGAYCTVAKDPQREFNGFDRYQEFSSRMSYVHQVIIGRKFNDRVSAQIAPWLVHWNQVESVDDKNDSYGVAAALRCKVTRSFALTAEYAYRLNDYSERNYYDSFGLGFEIETGGHVFQMHLTNSFGLSENQFLPYTDTRWDDGGFRLGFNVSRVFTL